MELTFYGGVDEIGGNKILLRDNDTNVFLDFSISYSRSNEYFEFPVLQPDNIDDLLKTKLIPELEGLYRDYSFKTKYDALGSIFHLLSL